MKSKQLKGSLFALLSGFLYGFVGFFGLNVIHAGISESTMTFWRFLIATIFMLVLIICKRPIQFYPVKQLSRALATGALFYGGSTICYFLTCRYISSGIAMVLLFTYPVMVMTINTVFFKQRLPWIYYLTITVILIGMLLMIDLKALQVNVLGILLALLSALLYAFYILTNRNNILPTSWATLMVAAGCMLTALISSVINHNFVVPHGLFLWLNLIGIGIFSTVFPVLLLLTSLKQISSERASILSVLEPVFVVILGVLLLGESLTLMSFLGILMVLSGALITLFSQHQQPLEK